MKNEDVNDVETIDFSEDINENDLYLDNLYNNKLKEIFSKKEQANDFYKYTSDSDNWDEVQARLKIDKMITDTFIGNIKIDIGFKKIYAIVLLVILSLQLIMVNIILILRGRNIIIFSDVTFNIFISGTLIEVIALVNIVVKYLFKDNISELVKDILNKKKDKS